MTNWANGFLIKRNQMLLRTAVVILGRITLCWW